ncbi:YidB family protein [Paenochrobactrum pullorum]|uniref:YidB family protein n=1 Tax=Paenochrobactrum pullorum TaxID=1324351 RepID=UPI0035BC923C
MTMFDNNSSKTPVPGGSLAKPVLVALGALLVGRMLNGKHDEDDQPQIIEPPVQPQDGAAGSGTLIGAVLGGLGSLLANSTTAAASSVPAPSIGNAGVGGALTGGLGGLLDQLTQAGHGGKVDSWLGQGENASIEPDQLGSAIGQKNLSEIAQHVGINEQDLLAQLSQVLPAIVDKLTADGKVPDMQDIARLIQKQN